MMHQTKPKREKNKEVTPLSNKLPSWHQRGGMCESVVWEVISLEGGLVRRTGIIWGLGEARLPRHS